MMGFIAHEKKAQRDERNYRMKYSNTSVMNKFPFPYVACNRRVVAFSVTTAEEGGGGRKMFNHSRANE